MTKYCPKCQQDLPADRFGKDKSTKSGLAGHCKDCRGMYRRANMDRLLDERRKYYASHKQQENEYSRRYYAEHKAAQVQRVKDYRIKNPEKYAAHLEVTNAIQRGDLPHARTCKCKNCGNPAMDYHHADYTKPLDVVPLCRICHKRSS